MFRSRWTFKAPTCDWRCDKGSVAILFALSATALFTAVGAGIDLARTYTARQKLSEVATLACQYASRPSVIQTIAPSYSGANGGTTYSSNVNNYITAALRNQQYTWTQTNGTPFTYTVNGPADVNLASSVPTTLMKVFRINQLSVAATSHCYDNSGSITQTVPDGNSPNLISESFENIGCSGTCFSFYPPSGAVGTTRLTPLNTFPSTVAYTGTTGVQWYVMGYCLEVDTVGLISSSVPDGSRSVELDCDNGLGIAGNSSISTKTYVAAGSYELRYFFRSRANTPDYMPAYVCGSAASDVAWANAVSPSPAAPLGTRTNQINVYFDLNTSGQPPTHTTIDGLQTLAGSNLIDVCVDSVNWIERSVRINVTTPGYYWLSFAADGQSDSYGGQLDSVRLCQKTCTTTLQDNFPSTWLAANNGGVNKILFRDTFESPVYVQDYPYHWITKSGNLNLSLGTSGTAGSGWPSQLPSGWATAPYNQVNYGLNGAYQGSQHILLDGYNASGTTNRNRLVSRRFFLDPGYYQLDYGYISIVDFSPVGVYGTFCWNMPSSGFLFGPQGATTGTIRYYNTTATDGTTNVVASFMSHGSLVSTPNGGGLINSLTSYTNPDGTISTTPTVPPDAVNYASYDATAVNPVLDVCGYADSYRWVARTAKIKITKPGPYWLSFSANGGTADGNGGGVDDVKLTALGSLAMTSPPASAVTIPVPNPQPGATISFSGFSIAANPLIPPAPLP